jgi:NADPH:quinone reductase-like Zn-dependent oxidoreductase
MPATITETMKAVCIHAIGGPEVLQYEDVRTPEPGADDMLIRVHAAGVNPVDWKIREGYLGKFPLPAILGRDFSGTVEALGQNVHDLHVGDEVFGEAASGSGTYAEFTLAKPSQSARKPRGLDHVQAAALPVAALTAWQALFDIADLRGSQKVLVHAAAGGVGSFAVQFAKLRGAYVIGTASAQNAAYVRELGADEVIDYHATQFENEVRDIDVVFDAIGDDTQEHSWQVLKRGGILVSIVQPAAEEKAAAHGVRGVFFRQNAKREQLAEIADLVVNGRIKLFIADVLPLSDARKAQKLSQSGHTRGKIVLTME